MVNQNRNYRSRASSVCMYQALSQGSPSDSHPVNNSPRGCRHCPILWMGKQRPRAIQRSSELTQRVNGGDGMRAHTM